MLLLKCLRYSRKLHSSNGKKKSLTKVAWRRSNVRAQAVTATAHTEPTTRYAKPLFSDKF